MKSSNPLFENFGNLLIFFFVIALLCVVLSLASIQKVSDSLESLNICTGDELVLEQLVGYSRGCQDYDLYAFGMTEIGEHNLRAIYDLCIASCEERYYVEFDDAGDISCAGYWGESCD